MEGMQIRGLGTKVLFLTTLLLAKTLSSLHNKFSHFQELKPADFQVRVKRNTQGHMKRKHVNFKAYGKNFQMVLKPGSPVLAGDFTIDAVHGNGSESQVHVDMEDIYHGGLRGDKSSWVSAVHHEGAWTAFIFTASNSYYVEPLRRHDRTKPKESMLIYRHHDVRPLNVTNSSGKHSNQEHSFCRTYSFDDDFPDQPGDAWNNAEVPDSGRRFNGDQMAGQKQHSPDGVSQMSPNAEGRLENEKSYNAKLSRVARDSKNSKYSESSEKMDTCSVIVLADYLVYKGMGESNINSLVKHLISVYMVVDRIFSNNAFGSYKNIRIMMMKMKIFTSPLSNDTIGRHLHLANKLIKYTDLLKGMTRIKYMNQYCLGHLTTQRIFGGVLGVAVTAKPNKVEWATGICGGLLYFSRNVGLSTVIDKGNFYVSFKTYSEIVAHEIGHNFGATHDKKEDIYCAPSTSAGGKYIMWYRITNSQNRNHKTFSPCSRHAIATILEIRAAKCLKPAKVLSRHHCGNGRVDFAEECDLGLWHMDDPNGCCKNDCSLADHAVCSPFNSPCCSPKCSVAPPSQKCVNKVDHVCTVESYCDGVQFDHCPIPKAKPNGSPCGDGGECHNGRCVDFCSLEGSRQRPPVTLTPCDCDHNATAMCHLCCIDLTGDQACRMYGATFHDGAPCLQGFCSDSVCIGKVEETEDKAPSMVNDLVGTVVVGVLLISLVFVLILVFVIWAFRTQRVMHATRGQLRQSETPQPY